MRRGSQAKEQIRISRSGRSRTSASGQQATFTDASRVFLLNVQNREANQALHGQQETLDA